MEARIKAARDELWPSAHCLAVLRAFAVSVERETVSAMEPASSLAMQP